MRIGINASVKRKLMLFRSDDYWEGGGARGREDEKRAGPATVNGPNRKREAATRMRWEGIELMGAGRRPA